MNRRKYTSYKLNNSNTDYLLIESNNYLETFNILINTTLSIFLGTIQENIIKKTKIQRKKENQENIVTFPKRKITYNFLKYFTIPQHLSHKINKYLKHLEQKGIINNKPDDFSFEDSLFEKITKNLDENDNNSNIKVHFQ